MPSGTSQNDGYTCLPSEQRAAYNTVHNNTYLPHGRSVPFSWGETRLAALSVEWPLPVQQAQLPRLTHATVCLCISAASRTGTRARVARVRAEYPSQLDYSGFWKTAAASLHGHGCVAAWMFAHGPAALFLTS